MYNCNFILIPKDIKQVKPKDCINDVFKNKIGVLSVLSNMEDIIKSNSYFHAIPQNLHLVTNDLEITQGDKILCRTNENYPWVETVVTLFKNNLMICTPLNNSQDISFYIKPEEKNIKVRKIIATTNKTFNLPLIKVEDRKVYVNRHERLKKVKVNIYNGVVEFEKIFENI